MRVLVTGATGFVGRALVLRLLGEGHQVRAWVRDLARARDVLGAEVELRSGGSGRDDDAMLAAVEEADAVIHLAGENILQGRWDAERKQTLRSSRVDLTEQLVQVMARANHPPGCLLSASAIGYYGDRGTEKLPEHAEADAGFLGQLCQDWERAALSASELGIRVACMRIGIVLGSEGAALARMLPLFKLGVGGPMGSGRQYVSWVHLQDLVDMFMVALHDDRYRGPINAVAPEPVTNAQFSAAIGRAARRPSLLKVPGWVMRGVLGESASVLLGGQRVVPTLLQHLGYEFSYPDIDSALQQIIQLPRTSVKVARVREQSDEPDAPPDADYLLEQHTMLHAPLPLVFSFFARAENLGAITPGWMKFEILHATPGDMGAGTRIRYRIRLGPWTMRWVTEIHIWEPGVRFVDNQASGPYSRWSHAHLFEACGDSTLMTDRVHYRLPGWGLGRLVHRILVGNTLRRIFAFRAQAIRHRFMTQNYRLPDEFHDGEQARESSAAE